LKALPVQLKSSQATRPPALPSIRNIDIILTGICVITLESTDRYKVVENSVSTDTLQFNIRNCCVRLGDRFAVFAQSLKMQFDCFPDVALDFFYGSTGRDATGQIRNIGGAQ
jgi:hypothetical protein